MSNELTEDDLAKTERDLANEQSQAELDHEAVSCMIDAAEAENLLVEVVLDFARNLRNSDSVSAACAAALYEWDI